MKQIELLLLDNVDNLGIVGDVVQVRPGYARNYLLPHGLATIPSAGAVARLAERRAEMQARMQKLRGEQEQLIERLADYELTLPRSANEQGVLYGGVSQHEIAQALREEGFDVEDRFVRLGEQIKRLDNYTIPIIIDKELKTRINMWIVSDKPVEELETEFAPEDEETVTAEGEMEVVATGAGETGMEEST